jgi:hypothetical protein
MGRGGQAEEVEDRSGSTLRPGPEGAEERGGDCYDVEFSFHDSKSCAKVAIISII